MTTIQILVAGLVALVPVGEGEMTLLLPKVETEDYCTNFHPIRRCCEDQGGRHIPDHHAFLGYEKGNGFWLGTGKPSGCGDDDDLCWIRLESAVVTVVNGGSGAVEDDLPGRMTILRTMPTGPENLAGFSWLAEMDRVTVLDSDGAVSSLCGGGGIGLCPVRGRVGFHYNRRLACRLSDSEGSGGKVTMHEFVFKKRTTDPTMGAPTQALAVASLFELVSAGENAFVEIRSPEFKGTLAVEPDSDKIARLIFTQFIPNGSAQQYEEWYANDCIDREKGRDSHFIAYYGLLQTRPSTPMLPFVKSTKEFSSEWIEKACEFPHLKMPGHGKKELFQRGLIPPVSPVSAAPPGYEESLDLAGPPLCPQAVFKPAK